MEQSEHISFLRRLCFCSAAWIIAVIAMAVVEWGYFDWEGVLLPPAFSPLGFPILLLLTYADPNSQNGASIAAGFGWLYYLALTVGSLRAKQRSMFIRVFTVLCISLLLNVAGCEAMKHGSYKTEKHVPSDLNLGHTV